MTDSVNRSVNRSVERLSRPDPTDGRTDGLTKNSLQDVDQSFTSVPHARIPNDHELAAKPSPDTTPDDTTKAAQ